MTTPESQQRGVGGLISASMVTSPHSTPAPAAPTPIHSHGMSFLAVIFLGPGRISHIPAAAASAANLSPSDSHVLAITDDESEMRKGCTIRERAMSSSFRVVSFPADQKAALLIYSSRGDLTDVTEAEG